LQVYKLPLPVHRCINSLAHWHNDQLAHSFNMTFTKTVCLYILGIITSVAYGQPVRISLLNEVPLKSVVISSLKGNYRVYADNAYLMELTSNDAIYISLFGQRLLARNAQHPLGNFTLLSFKAIDADGVIRLNPVTPSGDPRQYNDHLHVSVAFDRISVINEIQPDNYIAGVVEAEAGSNAAPEFYKAQAVLARTYLYGHVGRHESEGFQMCDGVHCQAYKGRSVRNPAILAATKATSGYVLTTKDSALVTAVFHANCGGETESAANAWLSGKSYLISVKDPFCQTSPSFRWTKTISLDQWKNYLKDHGCKIPKNISPGKFDDSQISRKQFYRLGKDSIPTKQIRTDFLLRSAFFSVVATTKDITFNGHGFGHGVGMCQDGAMQMAKAGYKFDEILKFYFKDVYIIKLK
jgi:stage II sporulation protein D